MEEKFIMLRLPNSYIIRLPNDQSTATCSRCKINKELNEYYKHSVRSDGAVRYRPLCKMCRCTGPRKVWKKPVHENLINEGKQKCRYCKITKPLNEFYSNGIYHDGTICYRARCKACVNLVLASKSKQVYKTKAEKRSASPKNFIAGVHNHACKRKLHLGFNVDCDYLNELYYKQNGKCAITGVVMTYLAGHGRTKTNISLDRIDSNKGYVKGNVHLVCDLINTMKSNMPLGEFYNWCKLVVDNQNEKIQNT